MYAFETYKYGKHLFSILKEDGKQINPFCDCTLSEKEKEQMLRVVDNANLAKKLLYANEERVKKAKKTLKSHQDRIEELNDALGDLVDGQSEFDLADVTGLNVERCREIINVWER